MAVREHDVRLEVNGRELRAPISYSIDVDLLQPADAFSMAFPLDLASWTACRLDSEFTATIDGVPAITGYIDSLRDSGDGTFTVEGRDRSGRLVDESVEGAGRSIIGARLSAVLAEIVEPWGFSVTLDASLDRRLRRGSGKKAKAGGEPALTFVQSQAVPQRIEAGTSKWEAIERVCRPLGLIPWSSADGKQLIVAKPNYTQEPQFQFFETVNDGSNVERMSLSRSVASRYSVIEVSGSGRPPGTFTPEFIPAFPGQKKPKFVRRNRIGVAYDGPGAEGIGEDFQRRKRLFVVSEALSEEDAKAEAVRILARGKASARTVDVMTLGHGQVLEGASETTLYAPDLIARCYKEAETSPEDGAPAVLVDAHFYITRVTYSSSRDAGEQTALSLVPVGTELT